MARRGDVGTGCGTRLLVDVLAHSYKRRMTCHWTCVGLLEHRRLMGLVSRRRLSLRLQPVAHSGVDAKQ